MKSILNEASPLETILTAVKDVENEVQAEKDKYKNKDNYIGSSISSYTKNLVMSFPILFDDTLSLDTAQTIAKANERNIVTMLQLLFTSVAAQGAQYLGKYHKNIKEAKSVEDMMDAFDAIMEDADVEDLTKAQLKDALNEMRGELKQPKKYFPLNSLSESSINDYIVNNIYGKIVVREDNSTTTDSEEKREKEKNQREKEKNQREKEKNEVTLARQQILDGDFKKANELQPTMMIIYNNTIDGNDNSNRKSFVAGVKCRLINVTAMDIVERLVAKNKSKLSFKNLLRATTGEIRLVPDFLLCIKQAKINAKNAVKKGDSAKMWNTLETRANKSNYRKISQDKNDAAAITTLVINQETVNYMKSSFGLDVTKIADAKNIMSEYNLLCLVIADDSLECAKFLYDGNSSYEIVSYSGLNRDNKDDAYRKALNTISRR